MPLIQVDLDRDLYERLGDAIGSALHDAQLEVLSIPENDLFQIFAPREAGELRFDPEYNGVHRQQLVLIRITMVHMYSVATKRELFTAMVRRLEAIGLRADDVFITVVENGFEDWYAGK